MRRWCDSHGVRYIGGIGKNNRLREKAGALIDQAEWDYEATGRKQRPRFRRLRRGHLGQGAPVIVKAEHGALGCRW